MITFTALLILNWSWQTSVSLIFLRSLTEVSQKLISSVTTHNVCKHTSLFFSIWSLQRTLIFQLYMFLPISYANHFVTNNCSLRDGMNNGLKQFLVFLLVFLIYIIWSDVSHQLRERERERTNETWEVGFNVCCVHVQ